jgi:D-glycero-D-manno-heptose 1,7-bisphosphate phosphatase
MKLIVLDRDGVINQDSDAYIKSVEEWQPIPGSLEAIAKLYHAGYRIVIATNQSGLARGLFDIEDLNAMHRKLRWNLGRLGGQIEAVFFCPHAPDAGCRCRKPATGMIEDIGHRLQTSLTDVPFVGDSFKDIQAARAVGASPILVLTGKGQTTLDSHRAELDDVAIHADLAAAAEAILSN